MVWGTITLFFFVMSLLFMLKEIFYFVNCFIFVRRYYISHIRLILLLASISYIITFLITVCSQ